MTSPARWTTTVSPTRTSRRAISSSLCRLALETTTPPTVTGLQLGDRRQRAGAADLDLDRLDDRRRLFGGELVRDRPARAARDEAEPLLQREVVDLVDDAVDVVAERRRAAPRSRGNGRASPLAFGRARVSGLTGRPKRAKASIAPFCVVGERRAELAPGVGEEAQRPPGGDARVELAQRAGGGVARIGEGRLAGRLLARVERVEIGLAPCRLRRAPRAPPARRADAGGFAAIVRTLAVTSSPS